MAKAFFKNISKSFCIYLLAFANFAHAIQENNVDWLCWITIGLSLSPQPSAVYLRQGAGVELCGCGDLRKSPALRRGKKSDFFR